MATIKCFSGGKCVKVYKNIEEDRIELPSLCETSYSYKSGVAVALGHGFQLLTKDKKYIIADWRGDFLVEW